MTATCVAGAISRHGSGLLVLGDLAQSPGQDRAVTVAAGCELDGLYIRVGRIHGEMHPALLSAALHVMLARMPFPVAEEPDACALHVQIERAIDTPIWDLKDQGLLHAAQGAEVRNGPVQPRQTQYARHHTCGLSQRWLEQNFDREAEPDGGFREDGRAP